MKTRQKCFFRRLVTVRPDRLLYRDSHDYAGTLQNLGAELASLRPLDHVLDDIAARLMAAMNLAGVRIVLRQSDGSLAVRGSAGEGPADALQIPLEMRGEVCGSLSLGPKRVPSPFSPADRALLRTLASQTAVAIENASLKVGRVYRTNKHDLRKRQLGGGNHSLQPTV